MTTTNVNGCSVVMEREMPHPPEKIWRALTQGPLIEAWLMANDFEPIVGHKFTLRLKPMAHWDGVIDCEVLQVEPCTALAYTWNAFGDDAVNGVKTVVSWTLTPAGKGTLVRMEQSGFRPDQENNYQGATYGWQRFLAALEALVSVLEEV